jgi:hypothetical protein
MKIKTDFVTNSSSSSFVIPKNILSFEQIYQIMNHMKIAREINDPDVNFGYIHSDYDEWYIIIEDDKIKGSTSMDNFDMDEFLKIYWCVNVACKVGLVK